MVHGLETLGWLNARADNKNRKELTRESVPDSIALHPALSRRYQNRPWTEGELNGSQNVFATYAKDAGEPFKNKEGAIEPRRP